MNARTVVYVRFYSSHWRVKIAPIGTRTRNCFSLVRRSAGLSIPGRDTDFMSCSVFICALRSLYRALKSIPLHILYLKLAEGPREGMPGCSRPPSPPPPPCKELYVNVHMYVWMRICMCECVYVYGYMYIYECVYVNKPSKKKLAVYLHCSKTLKSN